MSKTSTELLFEQKERDERAEALCRTIGYQVADMTAKSLPVELDMIRGRVRRVLAPVVAETLVKMYHHEQNALKQSWLDFAAMVLGAVAPGTPTKGEP